MLSLVVGDAIPFGAHSFLQADEMETFSLLSEYVLHASLFKSNQQRSDFQTGREAYRPQEARLLL